MWVVILVDGDAHIESVSGTFNSWENARTFARGWAHELAERYESENGVKCTVEYDNTMTVMDPDGEVVWEIVWKELT